MAQLSPEKSRYFNTFYAPSICMQLVSLIFSFFLTGFRFPVVNFEAVSRFSKKLGVHFFENHQTARALSNQ